MNAIRKVFAEPLVHFLILGTVVFGLYSMLDNAPSMPDKRLIEISRGQLAQMFETFSRTWQRPPTQAEYQGLIDGYVKEEVFYREAQKMGLDQDDTVLRRRMQQKMEFLLEPSADELTPQPGELEAYFAAHADTYALPPQLAFRQIFFRTDGAGDKGETAAKQALARLRAAPSTDGARMGDPTLLPEDVALADSDRIASSFDADFAEQLLLAPTGQWFGPVRSQYGMHLVLVSEKVVTRTASFADVKTVVRSDWENARRKEIADKRYAGMRELYQVRIELPAVRTTSAAETPEVR